MTPTDRQRKIAALLAQAATPQWTIIRVMMPRSRLRQLYWRFYRTYVHPCLVAYDRLRANRIYRRYLAFTVTSRRNYVENLVLVATAMRSKPLRGGSVVECGTWKGGMAAGLIEICGPTTQYHFFDSFEGLPPAKDIDGEAAKAWQANTEGELYYDNCTTSLEEFLQVINRTGCLKENLHVYKGWFEDTLKEYPSAPISILRLDADWYDSTMICLETFWSHLIPGALIIIDDYYTFDGCSRAVHDFLSQRKAIERITRTPRANQAYIVKRAAEADPTQAAATARHDLPTTTYGKSR